MARPKGRHKRSSLARRSEIGESRCEHLEAATPRLKPATAGGLGQGDFPAKLLGIEAGFPGAKPIDATEKREIRKSSLYRDCAIHIPYDAIGRPEKNAGSKPGNADQTSSAVPHANLETEGSERNRRPYGKCTTGLPIGTQSKFLEAVQCADGLGYPMNTLLTVHWQKLYQFNPDNRLFSETVPKRISRVVERMRKWIGPRCEGGFLYIWVRESPDSSGEHLHIGFHLPSNVQTTFVAYVAKLFGEPARTQPRSFFLGCTEGEFACSTEGSWHLAEDVYPERKGYYIAGYLGKGEPSERAFRGKLRPNTRKPVRGKRYGGREKTDKYDAMQGIIEGTDAQTMRYDIARSLKSRMKK